MVAKVYMQKLLSFNGFYGLCSAACIPAFESVNASCGVDQLLLAGEKRMAFRTNFDVEVFAKRRTSRKGVSASANYVEFLIIRMNFLFHFFMSCVKYA